ncbi:MAG: DUF928 domain-containing protein [Spirulina sp. SIO3F2]|nr:DUF928 domain-containing protein [Spirulina sp. SIO3F2]
MSRFKKQPLSWIFILGSVFFTSVKVIQETSVLAQTFDQDIWKILANKNSDHNSAPKKENQAPLGNRDSCPYTEKLLTILVPVSPETGSIDKERTLYERPTWYSYVPYSPRPGRQLKFELIDSDENILYIEEFPLKGTPGIVSLKLPENVSGLVIGQSYRWVISIICASRNQSDSSGNPAVTGWIERVAEDGFDPEVISTDERSAYLYYLENLIWFDGLNELVELQVKYPNDPQLVNAWQQLAEAVDFDDLPRSVTAIDTE